MTRASRFPRSSPPCLRSRLLPRCTIHTRPPARLARNRVSCAPPSPFLSVRVPNPAASDRSSLVRPARKPRAQSSCLSLTGCRSLGSVTSEGASASSGTQNNPSQDTKRASRLLQSSNQNAAVGVGVGVGRNSLSSPTLLESADSSAIDPLSQVLFLRFFSRVLIQGSNRMNADGSDSTSSNAPIPRNPSPSSSSGAPPTRPRPVAWTMPAWSTRDQPAGMPCHSISHPRRRSECCCSRQPV